MKLQELFHLGRYEFALRCSEQMLFPEKLPCYFCCLGHAGVHAEAGTHLRGRAGQVQGMWPDSREQVGLRHRVLQLP